ncbi:MAG: DUF2155 domain-containing protein [Alphaproteobacteria bacterium]|jgi:hypothetical protein|nr:DUF2155 domain-containing protein [Alphaproteobacteria bacterium]
MKKVFIFLFSVFMPVVANAYIEKSTAVLRVLDKDAGKVYEHSVTVGDTLQFGKLNIIVKNCKQTDPFQAEDFFAFIEISERDKGQVYGNWMSRNEPGQTPLQHPDYDVWLVKCE